MTPAQQQRIDEYEIAATESDMLAQLATDRSKQAVYAHLAGHFRDLARAFSSEADNGSREENALKQKAGARF
ncbi:MAG TPA: hypothetical protein VMU69_25750 [Bradyrhizobium sp.]|nr:hypothetical protein [Bradyrhizobium sp.]